MLSQQCRYQHSISIKLCLLSIALNKINGFITKHGGYIVTNKLTKQYVYAPPNSGYATPEDEPLLISEDYEPMMEYPGTMRPGKHRENVPFEDLPLDNVDDIAIPWPYFQEIEWHHQWPAPHPHPVDIEDFIEEQGRWATVEDEAEMRRDARKGLKDRKAQEKEKLAHQIMDDTEEDDDEDFNTKAQGSNDNLFLTDGDDKDDEDEDTEDDSDDFLASLGLDDTTDMDDQTDDDDELPDLDFDDDDDDPTTATRVVPLDSLNDADELDDKIEISYDQDNEYDDGGFDMFDDMDDQDMSDDMGDDMGDMDDSDDDNDDFEW